MLALSRFFGKVAALDELTLSVRRHSLTALLGPAGSGKSLLLAALAGVEHATGRMSFDGVAFGAVPAHRRGFGVVLEGDVLLPHLSLADNLAFPLRMRHVPRPTRARMVAETMDLLQLAPLAKHRPDQLDPAEHQLGLLARAVVAGPRLLLLDEPFDKQDAAGRARAIAALRQIHRLLGVTTLVATRNGDVAMAVADHVAVLRDGAIEQFGTPDALFDAPDNDHIAGLLGEVNRLAATVLAIEDGLATVRLACGPVVEGTAGHGVQAGDACVLTLRPGRIALAPVAASEMGEGAIDARLVDVQFQGEAIRLSLLIGSGAELIVRRPAAAGMRGLASGRSASVAWQPHHAFVFRAAGSRPPLQAASAAPDRPVRR